MVSALLLAAALANSPFVVPPPTNYVSGEASFDEGFECVGDYDTACNGPSNRWDIDGAVSCPETTDIAAPVKMIHPVDNYGAGTQTAADLVIRGGIDEKSIAIDNNANCNAADTITASIGIGNAAAADCTCTYGTNWCTGTCNTDNLVAASLAACLDACTGIDSTSATDPATIQIDPTEGQVRSVVLSESDGTCSTVSNGTEGNVMFGGAAARFLGQNANGPALVNSASSNTVGTIFPDRAGTGAIGGTSNGLSFISGSTSWGTMSSAGVWAFRPTSPPATHFQVGSSGTLGFMFDTAITSLVINTGGAQGFSGWIETVRFCGDGPNATTIYHSPLFAGLQFSSASCVENGTEANADEIMWPYPVRVMTGHCGINDVANATITFTMRTATGDLDASTTCTTATGDSSGYLDCYFQDLSPTTLAAGALIDMKLNSTGNFSTGDAWCVVQVSR